MPAADASGSGPLGSPQPERAGDNVASRQLDEPRTAGAGLDSEAPAFDIRSTEVLERLLARMSDRDAADAPDLAGAIASILASRLEGTPLPDDVQTIVDRLDTAPLDQERAV